MNKRVFKNCAFFTVPICHSVRVSHNRLQLQVLEQKEPDPVWPLDNKTLIWEKIHDCSSSESPLTCEYVKKSTKKGEFTWLGQINIT